MTRVRLGVLGLATALLLVSTHVNAQGSAWLFVTGESLATYCRDFLAVRRNAAASDDQQLQRYAVCLGFVAGVSDALTIEGARRYCLPFRSEAAARLTALLRLARDNDLRADADALEQINDVVVMHPDAAVRGKGPYGLRPV